MADTLRYRCPECSDEGDWPADKAPPFCGLCAGDCGKDVRMYWVKPGPSDPGWEGERCQSCGEGYDDVYWIKDDELWARITGRTEGGGMFCPTCLVRMALAANTKPGCRHPGCADGTLAVKGHPALPDGDYPCPHCSTRGDV